MTEVVVERDGATERYAGRHRRRRVRRREHGEAAARPRRTTGIRTASRTAPTRSAATTCSTTARPCSRSRARRTRPSSRRRSGSTTSTSAATTSSIPLGNIQMVGKSQAADVPRREAGGDEARAGVDARARRPARDRLLALDRGSAARRRTASPSTATARLTLRYTATNDEAEDSGSTRSSSRCSGKLDMNHGHLIHRFAYMKNEIPVAGCAHQAGTCRFGTDPATRCWTRLPRARGRQPLRRRHELLPEHRRREPGADRDGELAARRRPPARAAA